MHHEIAVEAVPNKPEAVPVVTMPDEAPAGVSSHLIGPAASVSSTTVTRSASSMRPSVTMNYVDIPAEVVPNKPGTVPVGIMSDETPAGLDWIAFV